jgi:hypothetical protein
MGRVKREKKIKYRGPAFAASRNPFVIWLHASALEPASQSTDAIGQIEQALRG